MNDGFTKRQKSRYHMPMDIAIRAYRKVRESSANRLARGLVWVGIESLFRTIEDIVWKLRGQTAIECFGDSHVTIFRNFNYLKTRNSRFRFRVIPVFGATATGMLNPKSVTTAFNIFTRWLERSRKNPVLFMLGEIDCGSLIWVRAEQKGESPEKTLQDALDNYLRFLENAIVSHPVLVVCGATLPTIKDGCHHGPVASYRSNIRASQADRTAMTLKFNSFLKEWCQRNGAIFIDFDPLSLDPGTGMVKESLLNPDPYDHHYSIPAFLGILTQVFPAQEISDALARQND